MGYASRMSRVVIAGAGALGKVLAAKLAATHDVRAVRFSGDLSAPSERLTWMQADLTTMHGAEIALTGAHTVVMLVQDLCRVFRSRQRRRPMPSTAPSFALARKAVQGHRSDHHGPNEQQPEYEFVGRQCTADAAFTGGFIGIVPQGQSRNTHTSEQVLGFFR